MGEEASVGMSLLVGFSAYFLDDSQIVSAGIYGKSFYGGKNEACEEREREDDLRMPMYSGFVGLLIDEVREKRSVSNVTFV